MNPAPLLITLSALIVAGLGTLHLVFTCYGRHFLPRDAAVQGAMEATSPRIAAGTSMWRAWIGFNASHSLGAILFGAVYASLAWQAPSVLRQAPLALIGLAYLLSMLVLARAYWFRVPMIGLVLALASYGAGIALLLSA